MKKMLIATLVSSLAALALFAQAAPSRPHSSTAVFHALGKTKINVNKASKAQLETLPGIGPKIAAEIIKNRPYKNGKELQTKVKGIGEKTWKVLEPLVSF